MSETEDLYAGKLELNFLLETIQGEHCTRLLEIGSKFGRMLLRWDAVLPRGARVCAIDLPGGPWGLKNSYKWLLAASDHLKTRGLDVHIHLGNSHEEEAIEWAMKLGPYDLVFIDADHKYESVQKDWENYSPMTRMVAFHDISPLVCKGQVAKFYAEITEDLHHKELIENDTTPGIGIVWI